MGNSERGNSVRGKSKQIALTSVFSIALLVACGIAAMGADLRLIDAVRNQEWQQARILLDQHVDGNARSGRDSSALLWAAHWNDLETVERLIHAGADANAANAFRKTPLSEACTNGSVKVVDLLLKAGANPNTQIATGVPPIMSCARSGRADAVRLLVGSGRDRN